MDATASQKLAIREAAVIQSENASYVVSIEEETWPTLSRTRYWLYILTRSAEGFGTEFQKRTGHRHTSTQKVWP